MALPAFLEDLSAEAYFSTNYVVLDFETDTSHGDFGSAVHDDNGIVLASWKHGECSTVHSHFGSEFEQGELVRAIEEADFLVAHNAKYELMWLVRCGLDISDVLVYDTKIGEYVLFGNMIAGDENGLPPRSTSLDMCCKRRGWPIKDPVVDVLMKHSINPVSMPRRWLQGRCEQDVVSTEKLFLDQRALLDRTNRLTVQYTRCLLTPVLSTIEFNGMYLDETRVEEEYAAYTEKFDKLSAEMAALTEGINWRSPLQVGEFLYDTLKFPEKKNRDGTPKRTAKGKRLTDKQTLEGLTAKTAKQREFLSLKASLGKVGSALSKNLEFFVGVVREQAGLFMAEFNQAKTATHRLSSSGIGLKFELFDKIKKVQFQNLPRAFKRLFRARKADWLLCETDGSQLEFRIAAHLGRDEQAREDILNPEFDAHLTSGAAMEDMDYDELRELYLADDSRAKAIRTNAKPETFKPLYGGKKGSKKQERWYEEFARRYSGVAEAQQGWVQEVLQSKRLITEWGMRYYWPHARVSQSGYVNVETNICNYPVQAFATAEIIPIAVVYFWHRVKEAGLEDKIIIVNTIHDSIICEVHPDAVEAYKEISIQAFTRDVYNYLEVVYNVIFDFVPLGVGITVGKHWSEGKEESYDIPYDSFNNGETAA